MNLKNSGFSFFVAITIGSYGCATTHPSTPSTQQQPTPYASDRATMEADFPVVLQSLFAL